MAPAAAVPAPPCQVLVMAKAPLPGYAKTRLAAAIGPAAAARLAARLLDETIHQALAARVGPVQLCCAPDCGHPQFRALAAQHGIQLSEQGEGDLGQRLARAVTRTLQTGGGVLVIGTDAPALQAPQLRQAAALLARTGAVCGPAHDGGYVLLGLSRPVPGVFEGIAWSTDTVLAQTRARFQAAGLALAELAPLHDIDTVQDLAQVPPAWWQP